MVSEGVDIPRLRVGVYATTVQSELFFRQAIGRFVRLIPSIEEQSAALFIPADSRLMHHALAIKEEREHHLRAVVKIEDDRLSKIVDANENGIGYSDSADGQADAKNGESKSEDSNFEAGHSSLSQQGKINEAAQSGNADSFRQNYIVPLSSTAKTHVTIFDGARYSAEELQKAAALSRELGINLPSPQVAALLRYGVNSSDAEETKSSALIQSSNQIENSVDKNNQSAEKFSDANTLKSDRKNTLRKEINRMANRLAHKFNVEFDAVHRCWIQQNDGSSHRDATEEELRRKFQWLVSSFNQNSFTGGLLSNEK
jgi:type I site-specific restriction endonuclease